MRPTALESELKVEEDQLHYEVYQVAGSRICTILQDKDHYMNGKMEPVQASSSPQPKASHKGDRVEVLRQLTLRAHQPGTHKWEMHNNGVKCNLCNKKIKMLPAVDLPRRHWNNK